VILAGYMRLLSPEFIAAFPESHSEYSSLAAAGLSGLDAQQQAFDYGCKVAGCTVHFCR
jgi:phosphoribosylglycinamide formyltransferase-1